MRLFLLDSFNPNLFGTHEYTLALVRFRRPKLPQLCSIETQQMLVRAKENYSGRQRHLDLDVCRNGDINPMRMPKLHRQTLPGVALRRAPRIRLNERTETNANQVHRHREALRHPNDRIVDERPGQSPHRALKLDRRVFHCDMEDVLLRER